MTTRTINHPSSARPALIVTCGSCPRQFHVTADTSEECVEIADRIVLAHVREMHATREA